MRQFSPPPGGNIVGIARRFARAAPRRRPLTSLYPVEVSWPLEFSQFLHRFSLRAEKCYRVPSDVDGARQRHTRRFRDTRLGGYGESVHATWTDPIRGFAAHPKGKIMSTSEISRCARGSRARARISRQICQSVLATAVVITLIATAITSAQGQTLTPIWLLAFAGGTLLLHRAKPTVAFRERVASREIVPVLPCSGIYQCMDRP